MRVDSGVVAGSEITGLYDPMIAKVMAVGPDRVTAIARLGRALDEAEITGIQTTLPFDRRLARDPSFVAGDVLSTDWVAERWDGPVERTARWPIAASAAAAAMTERSTDVASSLRKDESAPRDAWRDAGRARAIDRWRP